VPPVINAAKVRFCPAVAVVELTEIVIVATEELGNTTTSKTATINMITTITAIIAYSTFLFIFFASIFLLKIIWAF
jgi:hypothetical protein